MKKALLLLAGLSMLALSSCSDSDDEKLIVNNDESEITVNRLGAV